MELALLVMLLMCSDHERLLVTVTLIFLCHTTSSISHFLKVLNTLINISFLPTLTDQTPTNNLLCKLLSLPIQEGGVGMVEPST